MNFLPIDILGIIFTHLNPSIKELAELKAVCKQFYLAIKSPKLVKIWQGKYLEWWGNRLTRGHFGHKLIVKGVDIIIRKPWYIRDGIYCRDE